MPYLTISRSSKYEKLFRHISISINGKFYGSIKKGAKLEVHLSPGEYQVQAHLDWLRSNELEVIIDQSSNIHLNVTPSNSHVLRRVFLKNNPYLKLERIAG